jgi:hypothetical protein
MITKARMEELKCLATQKYFFIPKGIVIEKILLPKGVWHYVFKHHTLGQLGHLVILIQSNRQLKFMVKIAGLLDDPIRNHRRALLAPIIEGILKTLKSIFGNEAVTVIPYAEPDNNKHFKSEVPCAQCGKTVALLIYASDATYPDELENYAHTLYNKIHALNVPTWIIGAETNIKMGSEAMKKILVLKLWPKRVNVKEMLSISLQAKLEPLITAHC